MKSYHSSKSSTGPTLGFLGRKPTDMSAMRLNRTRSICITTRAASTSSESERIPPTLWQRLLQAPKIVKVSAFTGTYISLAGLALILCPKLVFGLLFDATQVTSGWIRVGGVLAALFGFYYLGSAYGELTGTGLRGFYLSTVWGRIFLSVCFAAFVAAKESPPMLLLLAAFNLLGAWNMYRNLPAA